VTTSDVCAVMSLTQHFYVAEWEILSLETYFPFSLKEVYEITVLSVYPAHLSLLGNGSGNMFPWQRIGTQQ
jgi:hypothetical protein